MFCHRFVHLLQSVLDCEKNLMVVHNSKGLGQLFTATLTVPAVIDVWVVGGWDDDTIEVSGKTKQTDSILGAQI